MHFEASGDSQMERILFSGQASLALVHAFCICQDGRFLVAAEKALLWSQSVFDKEGIPEEENFAYFGNFYTKVRFES